MGSSREVSIGGRVEVKKQLTVCASGVCTSGVCARGACVCGVLVLVEDVLDLGLDLFHSSSHCDCCLY